MSYPRAQWSLGHLATDIGVEVAAIAGGGDEAGADGEIAEALTFLPPGGISRKEGIERGDDAVVIEILGVELVHARAVEGAAEIEIVATRPLPHQSDLGDVWPCAAVRAAGHADDDVVGGKPVHRESLVQRVQQLSLIHI